MTLPPSLSSPSALLVEYLEEVRAASQLGTVVDLACGRGRHSIYLAEHGIANTGLDRNRDHLRELRGFASQCEAKTSQIRCDLEAAHVIPLKRGSCGAILIFRFLARALSGAIQDALCSGGLLIFETFAEAHRATGRGPRSPEYYLSPGELPRLFPDLEVIHFAEGDVGRDAPDFTARLVARKP